MPTANANVMWGASWDVVPSGLANLHQMSYLISNGQYGVFFSSASGNPAPSIIPAVNQMLQQPVGRRTMFLWYYGNGLYTNPGDVYQSTVGMAANAAPTGFSYAFYTAPRSTTYTSINQKYVTLKWNAKTEADFNCYVVYKSKVTNGVADPNTMVKKTFTKTNRYYDTAVREGTTYYYQVSAMDVYGNESPLSNKLTVPFPPVTTDTNRPRNLNGVADFTLQQINLSWV